MKLAILDDEEEEREQIVHLVESWLYVNRDDVCQVVDFGAEQDFVMSFHKEPAQIAFLDIFLSGQARGIEIAKALNQKYPDCLLVFITDSPDFALDGFALQAVHYCLKPVTAKMIDECLQRCQHRLDWRAKEVSITTGKETVRLELRSILYFESQGHLVRIYLKSGPHEFLEIRESMAELEEKLTDTRFLRVSRSYMINMDHVEKMDAKAFYMHNGAAIPISRREKMKVQQCYRAYLFEWMNQEF